MLLDILIFGIVAWILGTVVRLLFFRHNPAPRWFSWLSAILLGVLTFVAMYWGQQAFIPHYMESLFGPGYGGASYLPQPPIFSSIFVASIWFATIRESLKLPIFGRKLDASPTVTAEKSSTDTAPLTRATPPLPRLHQLAIFGLGAVAAIVVVIAFNPGLHLGQQSREQCWAGRDGVSTSAAFVAAQNACDKLPTDVELRCNTPFHGNTSSLEATLFSPDYGPWRVQMHSSDPRNTFGRFTIRIRFANDSYREYSVSMSEPLRPQQVATGDFEPFADDRRFRIVAWDFVDPKICGSM